jgi:hypothetical protein
VSQLQCRPKPKIKIFGTIALFNHFGSGLSEPSIATLAITHTEAALDQLEVSAAFRARGLEFATMQRTDSHSAQAPQQRLVYLSAFAKPFTKAERAPSPCATQ